MKKKLSLLGLATFVLFSQTGCSLKDEIEMK